MMCGSPGLGNRNEQRERAAPLTPPSHRPPPLQSLKFSRRVARQRPFRMSAGMKGPKMLGGRPEARGVAPILHMNSTGKSPRRYGLRWVWMEKAGQR